MIVLGLNVFIGVPSLFIIDIFRNTTPKSASYGIPNTTGLYKKGAMLCIRIHLQIINIYKTNGESYCFLSHLRGEIREISVVTYEELNQP
jgi:hypothetical protein|tara:strand:- start:1838 stop:2107 length:270 start_codon:yes stop_codon:yes gene_type:complete